MRVLLDYRPALRQRTGVGEYIHELARALVASAAHGEELYLFSSSWKDRLAPNAVPGAETVDRRIPVRVLNLAWHRLGWPRVEQVTGRQYDIVQSAHPLLIPARAGARVVTIADLDFLDHPERARAEIKRDYGPLAAAHAARADRVIVISRDTASAVEQRLGVPASKISICYPGAPGWARRDQEPFARTACVLFLGTLEPRKNLGVLLDAYERLLTHQRDVPPLVLAGRLGADAGGILSRATRPPLAGHVEIPGYIPDDQREALYRRALVFVIPSHMEGFGMPALEALRVGVPVVAARRGALPEVVGEAGRLVDPDDAQALATVLRDLLASRATRDRMREAGWRQAQRFQWSDAARVLREGWHLAVEERRRRHG